MYFLARIYHFVFSLSHTLNRQLSVVSRLVLFLRSLRKCGNDLFAASPVSCPTFLIDRTSFAVKSRSCSLKFM